MYSIKLLHNFHYIVEQKSDGSYTQYFQIGQPYYLNPRHIFISDKGMATIGYIEHVFQFLNSCPPSITKMELEEFINSSKGQQIIPQLSGLYIDGVREQNSKWVINLSRNLEEDLYQEYDIMHLVLSNNKCWERIGRDEKIIELSDREFSIVLHYIRINLFKQLLDYAKYTFKSPFYIVESPILLNTATSLGWLK